MKKVFISLFLIFCSLVGCSSSNVKDIDILNLDISYFSYGNNVIVINDYDELKAHISNYSELKNIDEKFFKQYDLLCILVSSNAEEYNNKINFEKVTYINNKYEFTFTSKIEDEATDLAFFLTSFSFKVNKELNIDEKKINIIKNRSITKGE